MSVGRSGIGEKSLPAVGDRFALNTTITCRAYARQPRYPRLYDRVGCEGYVAERRLRGRNARCFNDIVKSYSEKIIITLVIRRLPRLTWNDFLYQSRVVKIG